MPALSLRDIGVLPPPPPPPGGPTYTAPPPVYVASPPPATMINPFVAIAMGVNKTQSIAFAAVFGVLTLLLAVRFARGVGKHRMVYAFLIIIGAMRVATFVFRYFVATTKPTASSFQAILIASGVLLVAGFLFIVEAIMQLLWDWFCTVRNLSIPGRTTKNMNRSRHWLLVVISTLGIVGAVLQITSISKGDKATFNTAKHLRLASGALFIALCFALIALTIVVALLPVLRPEPVTKWPMIAVLVISTAGLMLESVYRVWAAAAPTGWATTQNAVDVMIVLPEGLIMLFAIFLGLDDLGQVAFVCSPRKPATQPVEQQEEPAVSDSTLAQPATTRKRGLTVSASRDEFEEISLHKVGSKHDDFSSVDVTDASREPSH
ncbi:uncharacterized protein LOC62_05G007595 [Vanrija pseudolonga]|uniref:Uncharacterized protein n=1 Tax=Vanrija pseudolonga TaxID=143232 RepID=A0AAF1BKK3_9TREE|nr:hypothetical protein LOC62_05G007595 [Vanrija pseudolonga]